MNKITKFYLETAVYRVGTAMGEVTLLVDYSSGSYRILGGTGDEIEMVAKTMLAKKHGVNFAYKFAKMEES